MGRAVATLPPTTSFRPTAPSSQKNEITPGEYRAIYIVAGVTALLLLITISLTCTYLCYRYNRKNKKKSKGKYRIVGARNPDITVQPYDFVLPPSRRHSSIDFAEDQVFDTEANSLLHSSNWSSQDRLHASSKGSTVRSFPDSGSSGKESRRSRKFSEPARLGERTVSTSVGLLRPELYQGLQEEQDDLDYPIGNIGRLWFRLEYNVDTEQLIVTLHCIKNLPARQQRGSMSMAGTSTCDPFVRIYLLPDEKRYLQSKMKRKTTCPTFEEKFIFVMSYSILRHRTLRFSVFDVDRFMRQTIIGHVLYPLERLDITSTSDQYGDLIKSSQVLSHSIGEILVATTYFPQQSRIGVTVVEAKNLQHPDYPLLDPYVKVSYSVLTKVIKTKRTTVQQATNNPIFNNSFEFKVNSDQLHLACLTLEVMHSVAAALKNDKYVGRIVMGGAMCSKGKELEHWNEMVRNPRISVKNWYSLKTD